MAENIPNTAIERPRAANKVKRKPKKADNKLPPNRM